MKPIFDAACIQIKITNQCNLRCNSCSQLVGHAKKNWFLSLDEMEAALQSLEGYTGQVGIFGGEPTSHPDFAKIVELYAKYIPRTRRALWTNGLKWNDHEALIRTTFPLKHIVYNDHAEADEGCHQPVLIGSAEIINDRQLLWELINNCWVQLRWSPIINKNNAFFCEVAGAQAELFNEKGWPVIKGWWKKGPALFQDQVFKYCRRCSMCIPLPTMPAHSAREFVSPHNLDLLLKNGATNLAKFSVYAKPYTREDYERYKLTWKPGQFRGFYAHQPGERLEHE